MDEFEACLAKGRLKPFTGSLDVPVKEFRTALEEMERAQASFDDRRFEEAVTQSYFAVYRSCKSLLLAAGYRDTNLYSLVAGMMRFYGNPGTVNPYLVNLLKTLRDHKDLVEQGALCPPRKARLILDAAASLVTRAHEVLANRGLVEPRSSS